jgi:hypothetical protein
LTVVKKIQAVTPRVAAFFFMLQGFDKAGHPSRFGSCATILQRSEKGHFVAGGFMSAFRFQMLQIVSLAKS